MKKVFAMLTIFFFIVCGFLASEIANAQIPDITLDAPVVTSKPAVKMRQSGLNWTPTSFVVKYDLLDEDGKVVDNKTCVIKDWEEVTTPGSCSDSRFKKEESCKEERDSWTNARCSKNAGTEQECIEKGGIWKPGFCSDPNITIEATCRSNINTWIPPVTTKYQDFSSKDSAIILENYVGMPFKKVIAEALHSTCAQKLGIN